MNKKELIAVNILNGKSSQDKELQSALVLQMINRFQQSISVDEDEFELVVEDAASGRAVSVRKAKSLLEDTGVFLCDNNSCWHYNECLAIDDMAIGWDEFIELFMFNQDRDATLKNIMVDPINGAIIRGICWILDMVLTAADDGHIDGLPAFFTCDDSKDYIIGFKAAGTATSDALFLICKSSGYLRECKKSADEISKCIRFLLEKILKCQVQEPGWDHGGFLPYEDQPESEHPTVEATCLAAMALATFSMEREHVEKEFDVSFEDMANIVDEAMISGLEFLFRMELSSGGFGSYRYKGDNPYSTPNENCTRMVLSTMGIFKGSGMFDRKEREAFYQTCSSVIQKAYEYLMGHRATDAVAGYVWAPYFGHRSEDYSSQDVIVSTAKVCRSFIPVWWQMEDQRDNILEFNYEFLTYWKCHEYEAAGQVGYYRFNSPSRHAFSTGEYFWASRPDMLAAFTVLQAYNLFGLALTKEDMRMVTRAVRHTLEFQHPHGHWDNPIAVKTPFCAVTLAAIELLIEYQTATEEE